MEITAGRGGSIPVPSSSAQPPRKEWRAVADHPFRENGSEEPEHKKFGQSEERTIYEEGVGPEDVDFCSITIDNGVGPMSNEMLQQRLQEISRQREELQHVEIELRAQAIVRAEFLEMQSSFQLQIKENADATSQLKQQLHDGEQHIHELEMQLEGKDRELRAIEMDNEEAWAKDDLLREQNKELATFRRERDNSEVERTQHLKQIHDLREHIQEKENQILALEEQHRGVQKTILLKDEQLRDAQTWITHAQEMDVLHSTTNQSLQAEIRDRAEQFTQYYFGLQRQCAEVERHHLQTIQRLQLELAEARERNEAYKDGSGVTPENSADSSSYAQNKNNQINVNDDASNGNLGFISNGNLDGHPSYVSPSNAPAKTEHVAGFNVVPSPVLGMGTFLPPGQMTALHRYVMHPQGVPQSVSSSNAPIPHPHVGHFQPMPTIPAHQQRQNQQVVGDVSQIANQNNYQPSQAEHNILRPDAHYSYDLPAERKAVHTDHPNTHNNQQQRSGPLIGSSIEVQLVEANGKQYQVSQELQETSNTNAGFHATIVYASPEQNSEIKVEDQNTISAISQSQDQVLTSGQQWSASTVITSAAPTRSVTSSSAAECNEKMAIFPESATRTASSTVSGKATEPTLLDERSLLACIVRAIPAGVDGRIRISTTLPNRLGKMLAPLHWHDYKKRYGKLDDVVAHHPELFVIEGDFIHLREGAQETISATAAFAKVAAAAASPDPYSSLFPSVALTPVAQNNRLKRVPSVDSKPTNTIPFTDGSAVNAPGDSFDKSLHITKSYNQQPNNVNYNIAKGVSDVNISIKSKKLQESNGLSSEMRPANSSLHSTIGNGENKGLGNGRLVSGGKQQARSTGAGIISRR